MDAGGNSGGLPVNNKQRAMLPNKAKGEFTRNPRKDSEVRSLKNNFEFTGHTVEAFSAAGTSANVSSVRLAQLSILIPIT